MLFTSQSMTSKQRCTCGTRWWFCGFRLERTVAIHPIFEPFPLNGNVARWWNCNILSHLPVLECTNMDHCGLMCLNDLYKSRRSSWTWSVTKTKTILLKTRKLFPCLVLSNDIVHIHGANGGAGGNMRACHAAGPGSISGRDKFLGWGFFGVFPPL